MHQATAEIGVATADYYPRITLTGNAGYQALALADMGSWSTHTFRHRPHCICRCSTITSEFLSRLPAAENNTCHQQTLLRARLDDDALSGYRAQQRRQFWPGAAANRRVCAGAR
ncbi:hypothetical protein M8494_33065 [Serratia ureilytica]